MNLCCLAKEFCFVKDLCYGRYQNGGWRCLGKNIEWDMVRAPSVHTPPYLLHLSHCLDTLKPEDHIEIQWRPNTQSPYGIILNSNIISFYFF